MNEYNYGNHVAHYDWAKIRRGISLTNGNTLENFICERKVEKASKEEELAAATFTLNTTFFDASAEERLKYDKDKIREILSGMSSRTLREINAKKVNAKTPYQSFCKTVLNNY